MLILNSCSPHGSSRRSRQEEEERQDGDQLEDHGHGAEPDVLPSAVPQCLLLLNLGVALDLEPAVVGELAQSRACDDDKGRSADKGDEVERQEDDELEDLDDAPWRVDRGTCGLSEHSDRGGRIHEENSLGCDKILV